MKNFLIILLSLVIVACADQQQSIVKNPQLKSLTFSHDTTITLTITSDMYETQSWPDIFLDSNTFVKNITLHYYENEAFYSQRLWQLGLVGPDSTDFSNLFLYPDSIQQYVGMGFLEGFMYQNQIINLSNINQRASEIWAFAEINTDVPLTCTIDLTKNPEREQSQFNMYLDGENDILVRHVDFTDSVEVVSIYAQTWGKLDRRFEITGKDISISDSCSVTNIKYFYPGVKTKRLEFSMGSIPSGGSIYNYGEMLFNVVVK